MHLLHRRGVNFEESAEQESATGTEEYSYSTKKDGATVTYVKTTRPIVRLASALAFSVSAYTSLVCRSTLEDTPSARSTAHTSRRPSRLNFKLAMS